jgi:hypothetical protein
MANDDAVKKFAENLVDDPRAAQEIYDRYKNDKGVRISLDKLLKSQGFKICPYDGELCNSELCDYCVAMEA